jgi:hypothetical protein
VGNRVREKWRTPEARWARLTPANKAYMIHLKWRIKNTLGKKFNKEHKKTKK